MKFNLLLTSLILITLFSCSSDYGNLSNTAKSNNDSLYQFQLSEVKDSAEGAYSRLRSELNNQTIKPENIECFNFEYQYGDSWSNYSPGTFNEKTYVYNSMDSNATILDSLTLASHLNILKEYGNHFLVCTPKHKSGFIKKGEVYTHEMSARGGQFIYASGVSKYGTFDDISCETSQLKIVKRSNAGEIVEIYTDSILGKDYTCKSLYDVNLKNVLGLFHFSYHCYGGMGISRDHFIIDNGKIQQLLNLWNEGDGGYSEISLAYFPIKLSNGNKVVLALNGKLSVNTRTGQPNFFPYPEDCNIPIEELIIVIQQSEEMGWDEELRRPKLNPDGTSAVKIDNQRISYYQWDGEKLHLRKQFDGKNKS